MAESKRFVIVGAGISGLATAWFLHRRGHAVDVVEAAPRPGGTIATERRDGWLAEIGPNSTLKRSGAEDALGRLIDQTGLESRMRRADPSAEKRYVLRKGRLIPLPSSPPKFITTPLFSPLAKLRLLAEPFIGRAREEESIADFVIRRLGREFLDYAVDPFISGVYAGDPAKLSIRAAVARIHALERDYGSLIRGAVAKGRVAKQTGAPRGTIVSFDGGMAELADGITAALPEGAVRLGSPVTGLEPAGSGWRVSYGNETIKADAVVVATAADAAARLVAPLSAEAAEILEAIPYAPVASAVLGFRRRDVDHALDGFGFLIPRREGVRTLGALFSSTQFPGRAPEGHALLTAFIGGTTDPGILDLDDSALRGRVLGDLSKLLGLSGAPVFERIVRWNRAIPQYTLGHLARVAAVDTALARFDGLHFRANWRDGISVADCVRNAEKLAESVA